MQLTYVLRTNIHTSMYNKTFEPEFIIIKNIDHYIISFRTSISKFKLKARAPDIMIPHIKKKLNARMLATLLATVHQE